MSARLHHIGIAVKALDEAIPVYAALFDIKKEDIRLEVNEGQKVRIAFVDLPNCKIELLEPMSEDSAIAKHIASRGEGIQHMCFVAPQELEDECQRLEAASFRVVAKDQDRFFFLHPKDCKGSLIEFYSAEHADKDHG